MEKEFNYRSDKSSEGSLQFGMNGDINTIDSKVLANTHQSYSSPFTGLPVTHEVHGTYRSNNAYDNTDKSIQAEHGYIIRGSGKNMFEQEEYWRTNI